MPKQLRVIAVALAVVLVGGGFLAWNSHKNSPTYALGQVKSAIEDRNRLRFQTYVDLDRLLPSVVDQLMGQAMLASVGSGGDDGLEALGAAVGSALGAQMKPALTQALRSAILRAVERGSLDSLYNAADTTGGINLAALGSGTGMRAETFRGITEIQREGDVALAGLRFHHEHLDTTLALQFRMERINDRWMIVAPENLSSYLQDVEQLRQAHLDRLNKDMRTRVAGLLEFGPLERDRKQMFGLTTLEIRQNVTNRSGQPIHLVFGWLEPPAGSSADREIMLAESDDLAPGESTSLSASFYGSAQMRIPSEYLSGDLNRFATSLSVVVGRGDSAEYVGPYSSWDEYLTRLEDPAGVAQRILTTSASSSAANPFEDLLSHADDDPWTISEDSNPLDDSPIVVLMTEARSGRTSYGRRPTLVLRCRNNTTEVYINWSDYLGSDAARVNYRIGDGEKRQRYWSLSTDNTATFFPSSPVALIKELMAADRFVAQVTPYNESPVTAVFDVSGLAQKIQPLREACHW